MTLFHSKMGILDDNICYRGAAIGVLALRYHKQYSMKAAVLYPNGEAPRYMDQPDPVPQNEDEILVTVKAAAIKHVDKSRASGKHYSSDAPGADGRIIGGDGVCVLEDGTRVYGMGVSGMLAQKAIIDKHRIVALPE